MPTNKLIINIFCWELSSEYVNVHVHDKKSPVPFTPTSPDLTRLMVTVNDKVSLCGRLSVEIWPTSSHPDQTTHTHKPYYSVHM